MLPETGGADKARLMSQAPYMTTHGISGKWNRGSAKQIRYTPVNSAVSQNGSIPAAETASALRRVDAKWRNPTPDMSTSTR